MAVHFSRLYENVLQKVKTEFEAYLSRITTDSGEIYKNNVVQAFYAFAERNGLYSSIQFAWLAETGAKKRTSTIYSYFTKLYNLLTTNDAAQTTEANQPRLTGNIAQGDVEGMMVQNGENRTITHTQISYAANEPWSVTTLLNLNSTNNTRINFWSGGENYKSSVELSKSGLLIYFTNESGDQSSPWSIFSFGKTDMLIFVAYGNGTIDLYKNGVKVGATKSIATNIKFGMLFNGYEINVTDSIAYGIIYAHIIRSQALTAAEVLAEYNFLRGKYPEIPSVTIGTQTWALRNCDQVASTNGTVIPDGTVSGTWDNGTSFWCFHTGVDVGSWAGKLYNKASRDVLIANPPSGWHVPTEAELTTLAAYGGNALKLTGTDYWTTTGGTNNTGFSALGGSSRNADGSFNTIKNMASFWCANSDKVLVLNHNDNTATITAVTSVNDGHSIRLIKD